MLFPTLRRIGEVRINICPVEDISCATGIENSIRRHSKSRKRLNNAHLIVPDQSTLAERHAANPAASTLEIIDHHRWGLDPHLLAQTLGYDRYVGESKELMSVLSQSSAVKRSKHPRLPAKLGIINRRVRLVAIHVKRAAA